MLNNLLLLISILLSLYSYIYLIIKYLTNKNKIINKYTGFDLAKEITNNYDNINIVESKEINISKYNINRKVIRLTPNTYNNSNYFSLAISSMLAGYSQISISNNKTINLISKIIKNLDYIDKTIIIPIVLSFITNNTSDAKLLLIILIIVSIYQYLLLDINENIKEYLKIKNKEILKSKEKEINKLVDNIINTRKIFFISNLVLILRLIIIILQI